MALPIRPEHLVLTRDGRFLIVSDGDGRRSLYVFHVDASSGALTAAAGSPFASELETWDVTVVSR